MTTMSTYQIILRDTATCPGAIDLTGYDTEEAARAMADEVEGDWTVARTGGADTYTVRPLGASAWVQGVSIDEAWDALDEAREHGLSRVVVVQDEA